MHTQRCSSHQVYGAAPFSLTTLVTVLVINHLLLTQLDSSMSLDVFLSFFQEMSKAAPGTVRASQ